MVEPQVLDGAEEVRGRVLLVNELEETSAHLPRMTWEEFLVWCDEDTHAEWVAGEVQLMSPVTLWHRDTLDFLTALLRHYCESTGAGTVRSAGYKMKTEARPAGREPDILFVASANEGRLRETFLDGPADLVVEIVSPESAGRDRGEKFFEYEAAGVREYWLLDPPRRRAEWYVLQSDGAYTSVPPDENGVYHSQVLASLWLREEWLWNRPKLLDVLRQWKLI
jgi:Uma2 family endonuclease